MANGLRFFVFLARAADGDCDIRIAQSFREVEAILDQNSGDEPRRAAFLFAGEVRPASAKIAEIMREREGLFLVSESARWLLPSTVALSPSVMGEIQPSNTHVSMPFYAVCSGCGYATDKSALIMTMSNGLQAPTREAAGLTRLKRVDPNDPFQIAKALPDGICEKSLTCLSLTVRLEHAAVAQDIRKIGDLRRYNLAAAMAWRNFGKKSVFDLARALRQFIGSQYQGLAPIIGSEHDLTLSERDSGEECDSAESGLPPFGSDATAGARANDTLVEILGRALSCTSERQREIIHKRMGLDGKRYTLEEIASEIGLTRERVRQIEEKFFTSAVSVSELIPELTARIEALRRNRTTPLYVDLLAAEDEWFAEIPSDINCLSYLIERCVPGDCKLCRLRGRPIITSVDNQGWKTSKSQLLQILKANAEERMTREEVELILEGFLVARGCGDLVVEMRSELSEHLHYGVGDSDSGEVLIAVGRSLSVQIRGMLERSDQPMHYSRVAQILEEETGSEANARNIHATLTRNGALYYGRGVYGTWRHMPFAEQIQSEVIQTVEGIVGESQLGRQWSATELLRETFVRRPDLPEGLDKYLLNILLTKSEALQPMGRFIWRGRSGSGAQATERVEIQDACIAILQKAGGPMLNRDLQQELCRIRGVSEYFLIHQSGVMARVAPNVWGLLDRDFRLPSEDLISIRRAVCQYLSRTRRGLHLTELREVVERLVRVPRAVTAYMLISVCQADPQIKVYRGQYIGLVEWGESRRLTIGEMIDSAASFLREPHETDEIVKHLSQLGDRTLLQQEVVNNLRQRGAHYDSERRAWFMPAVDTPDDEVGGTLLEADADETANSLVEPQALW